MTNSAPLVFALLSVLCGLVTACGEPVAASDSSTSAASISPEARHSGLVAALDGVAADFLKARVTVLADDQFGGRNNLSEGNKAARSWLIADLKKLGVQPAVSGAFEQPFDRGTNICAKILGDDPQLTSEVVIVGAHYDGLGTVGAKDSQCSAPKESTDTVCNGAIDNAAGVAVTLFVAQALMSAKHKPRRTVVFCLFDAEEDGLVGSYFATKTKPIAPLAQTVAMFSVDNVGSRIFPQHTSSFATDAEYSNALKAHVLAVNEASGFRTWPVSSFFVGKQGGGRSDHLPYREQGIPVLFVGSGSSSVYHTVKDEVASLDFGKLKAIARHTARLVSRVANADEKPDFVKDPQPHLDDARAMVAIADKVIAKPESLGLNAAQLSLVKQWRGELQAWLDKPPETAEQWDEYGNLVKAIIAAVYAFAS